MKEARAGLASRGQARPQREQETLIDDALVERRSSLIVQVRRAIAGDEPILRALRLQALSDTPDAFGSTYERELARTTADWQRWLSPGATFILTDDDDPRGIVAAAAMPSIRRSRI